MGVTEMFDNEFTNDEIKMVAETLRDISIKISLLEEAYFVNSPFTEEELELVRAFEDSFSQAIELDDNVDIELD